MNYHEHEIGCSIILIIYPSTRLLNEVIERYICEALYQDGNRAAYELDYIFWSYSAELSVQELFQEVEAIVDA